jgi:hypothetical protein
MELRRLGAGEEAKEDRPGQEHRGEQGAGGDQLGRQIAEHAIAKPRDDRGQQGQENDGLNGHRNATVIPAKAGISLPWARPRRRSEIPAFAGMTRKWFNILTPSSG